MIFFRDQALTPARQLAFARRWGEIHLHPYMQGMDDYPEILEIVKTPQDKKNFGGSWHSDQMFTANPAMGTMLYGKVIPSAGGDTMWTNQYLAYESLSEGMRRMLDPMKAVSRGDNFSSHDGKTRKEYYADKISMKVRDPGSTQTVTTAPADPHASGDGAQGAVHRRPCPQVRGHDGAGEPAADRLPDAALDAAGIHLPLPLEVGLGGVLGQPLHPALRDQRLPGRDADHAPRDDLRRHAVLM